MTDTLGNGHMVTMQDANLAAVRLRQHLWTDFGVDPQGVITRAVLQPDGEVRLQFCVDGSVRRQPPDKLVFEDYNCEAAAFDGTIQMQPFRVRKGPRYG